MRSNAATNGYIQVVESPPRRKADAAEKEQSRGKLADRRLLQSPERFPGSDLKPAGGRCAPRGARRRRPAGPPH